MNTLIHHQENDRKRVDFMTGKRERISAKCRVLEINRGFSVMVNHISCRDGEYKYGRQNLVEV